MTFMETAEEFKKLQEEVKNPVFVGLMLHKISEEKASTAFFLKEINSKLDKISELEKRISDLELRLNSPQKAMLTETDEEIVALITQKGKACADDVQKQFNYKGANAASARLNNLVRQGFLQKIQAGKKMYFLPVSQMK